MFGINKQCLELCWFMNNVFFYCMIDNRGYKFCCPEGEKLMKNSKTDLRVRMTKAMLRKGLTDILISKPIQEITVSELCEKAGINRSTFYAHYMDIYDLLNKIEDEMFIEFHLTLNKVVITSKDSTEQIPVFIYTVFDFLMRNSDMCIILLGEHSDRRFVSKLFNSAREKSIEEYVKEYPNTSRHNIELFYAFVASGCIGLLEFWLENGMRQSAQEMAYAASKLIKKGVAFLQ